MAVPSFGRADRLNALAEKFGGPRPEVLGTVPTEELTQPDPLTESAAWSGAAGDIELEEGPPPWEIEDKRFSASDARRFVDVPATWTLRWINPRLLDSTGWQEWRPVTKGDPRVRVKVDQMVGVDGNIRRGGVPGQSVNTSDILAYMPTHWVESRRRLLKKATDDQTQRAVDKQESLKDEFRRGSYGPYLHLDSVKHPTHTQVEGRSIRD